MEVVKLSGHMRLAFLFAMLLLFGCLFPQSSGSLSVSQNITSYGTVSYSVCEYGFCISGPYAGHYNVQAWKDKLVGSGAKWVRFDIYGMDDANVIISFKEMINTLHNLGVKVIGVFAYDLFHEAELETFTLQDWRNKVIEAITALQGCLDAVEVWNEPDLVEYCHGYMDGSPEHYFDMLKAAYEEIKTVDSEVMVLAPAVCTLDEGGQGPSSYWGGHLLKEIWNFGAANYCDKVSFHVYQFWLDHYGTTPKEAVEKAYEITGKPIFITETGEKSSGNGASEESQAAWMEEEFSNLDGSSNVEAIIWYRFYGSEAFSVVNPDYTPKLAYEEFRSFATN